MSKFTVNFGPKSEQTLKRLAEMQEATQTEVVRRALGLYATLLDEAEKGNTVVLRGTDGSIRELLKP